MPRTTIKYAKGISIRTVLDMAGDRIVRELKKHKGTKQVISEVQGLLKELPEFGGKAIRNAIREWADRLGHRRPFISSAIQPIIEDVLREVGTITPDSESKTKGEATMSPKSTKEQSGLSDILASRVRQNISGLGDPDLRRVLHTELDNISGTMLAYTVNDVLSRWKKNELQNLASDLKSEGDDADIVQRLGADLLRAKPTYELSIEERALVLQARMPIDILDKLVHAMGGAVFETNEADEARFNRKLSALYRDGSNEALRDAEKIIRSVADLDEDEIRNWFNIDENPWRTFSVSLVRHIKPRKRTPVSEDMILAARDRRRQAEKRNSEHHQRRNQRRDTIAKIVIASRYARVSDRSK